jgi:thioredoxin-related protein
MSRARSSLYTRSTRSTRTCSRVWSIVFATAVTFVMGAYAQAADGWLIHYDEAIAEAKKTGRPILANFTGSDWCSWCIKLKEEVFQTTQFKEWAAKKVVLLELDFPQQTEQDPALAAKNQEILNKYGVQGFPTVLIIDADGKQVGELGYQPGGPQVWIEIFENQAP